MLNDQTLIKRHSTECNLYENQPLLSTECYELDQIFKQAKFDIPGQKCNFTSNDKSLSMCTGFV